MSDKIIEFPRTKSNCGEPASQTAQAYNLADMLDCLDAMRNLLIESHAIDSRPMGIAISVTLRDAEHNLESYSAYCANEKHSVLGSLEVLKHRILTGDKP